ncbi:Uncharacterized protein LOCC1_G000959 [Lachnellula occidentalis]|uniref:Calcineurin-like phosphoesterase domain-containing protein n=1 Tax=Lachnellula occidentalis TaxID=215460 RepID=A0A8H8S8U6_9HELO|nr:Uncharacterized protein LOCC1_G000959 [Lachnellula occidentalis]
MSSVKIQLMSDLHLETPQARPTYQDFEIPPECQYLALLGDIGNVTDNRLFAFLENQLRSFEVVFYLLGNHEPFGMTRLDAQTTVRAFEHKIEELRSSAGTALGKFVFLDQTRYDLTEDVTVLGCTLFSRISNDQRESVSLFCSDFSEIQDWTVDTHNAAHDSDLHWLDMQVEYIAQHEPQRKILVFTHHSPTLLEDANDPRHLDDAAQVRSAFVTDLSDREFWKNANVKLWAFGHTHFNCDFVDPGTGRRVVANQKGYRRTELDTFDVAKVVEVNMFTESEVKG